MTSGALRHARLEQPLVREMAGKGAAPPLDAFDLQAPAMAIQRVLDYREAQARAAGLARAAWIDPVKAFREARNVLGWNARAGIPHREMCAGLVGPPAYVH